MCSANWGNRTRWKPNRIARQCGTRWLYLNDLLIRHPGHEEILFVLVWVELDAVWYLPVGEPGDTLACGEGGGGVFKRQSSTMVHSGFFIKVHPSCFKF